jgi:hypothetical protein
LVLSCTLRLDFGILDAALYRGVLLKSDPCLETIAMKVGVFILYLMVCEMLLWDYAFNRQKWLANRELATPPWKVSK